MWDGIKRLFGIIDRDVWMEVYDRQGKLISVASMNYDDPVLLKYSPNMDPYRVETRASLFVAGVANGATLATSWVAWPQWLGQPGGDWRPIYWSWYAFAGTATINLLTAAGLVMLGRTYRMSRRMTAMWAAAGLGMGLMMLLIFAGFYHWPARTKCGGCGKWRAVKGAQCPRCGASLEGPKVNGTEIFA